MTQLIGASEWEQELYAHLISHVENERELLEQYRDVASSSQSNAFRYLSSLIIEDEIRHHRIFAELASALKNESELSGAEPVVPRLDSWGPDAAQVVELSDYLLEQEYADAKELRHLAGGLKDVRDSTMWQLLVRIMEMDTKKHIEILNFTKRHARRSLK
jgi:rubrerythrin